MEKMIRITNELSEEDYRSLEQQFIQNRAENMLYLLRAYRHRKAEQENILKDLGITQNSLYVLKSRLYDKIQSHLSGNIFDSPSKILLRIHEVPEICHSRPREVTIAFLTKLEEELLRLDMHSELIVVYSALKKMTANTERYFHYSQLYNKHITHNLAIEKAQEILSSFNTLLGQYDLSRSQGVVDRLVFLQQEIRQHLALNKLRQIEVIACLIDVQVDLFCPAILNPAPSTLETLQHMSSLISASPSSSPLTYWVPCVQFLEFEYALSQGQLGHAASLYKKLIPVRENLLLSTHVAVTSFFPLSEQIYLGKNCTESCDGQCHPAALRFDRGDHHSQITTRLATAVHTYRTGAVKESALQLNQMLNDFSMKDSFHLNLEIKLMLIFIYIQLGDMELAAGLHRNIVRKIKVEHAEYENALHLCNAFGRAIKQDKKQPDAPAREQFLLFEAKNRGKVELLRPMQPELSKKYKEAK